MRGCYGPLTPQQLADLLATGTKVLVSGPWPDEASCYASGCATSGSGGSGSGSGGSGSGAPPEGCPCDPLPLTLSLSFEGTSGGALTYIGDQTAVLNYNPVTGNWVGSTGTIVGGTQRFNFVFLCRFSAYYLEISPVGGPGFTTYAMEIFEGNCAQIIIDTGDAAPLGTDGTFNALVTH